MVLHYLVHTTQATIKVWAGKLSSSAACLNMVQHSAVVVGFSSRYCFRSLVHADKHGLLMVRVSLCSHQPPAVLHCPCVRTGVPSWDHDLLGASGHFTHSAGSVVLMQVIQCLPTGLIFRTIQNGMIFSASCSFRIVLNIISVCCADVEPSRPSFPCCPGIWM